MRKIYLLALTLSLTLSLGFAQTPSQVIVANGGVFSPTNHASIAYWEPGTSNYTVFDSVPASSVQDVILQGNQAWLAADSFLVRYNIDTYTREAIVDIKGIRKLALHGDKVIATRGFGASGDYVQAFDKMSLSPAFSISGLSGNCEGIAILGDSAYVAVPVAFGNATGKLAVIDLVNESLSHEVDFDTMGRQIGRVFIDDDKVYTINSIGFMHPWGVVSEYDITTLGVTHHRVEMNVDGGTGIYNGLLYAFFDGAVGSFDIGTGMVQDTAIIPGAWAASAYDPTADQFYLTNTDFFSFGNAFRYDGNGVAQDTQAVGISPEAIALDIRLASAASAPVAPAITVTAFPNPVAATLHVDWSVMEGKNVQLELRDLQGRTLHRTAASGQTADIDMARLPAGVYLLTVRTDAQQATLRILK